MNTSGIKHATLLQASILIAAALFPLPCKAARIIAFDSGNGSAADIYTMNDDGTARKRVTTGTGQSVYPNWSPNGARIAYMHLNANNDWDIWTIGGDGSGALLVAGSNDHEQNPIWSPDGKMLAYSRSVTGSWQNPWVVNADGSGNHALLSDPSAWVSVRGWSADGSYLLLESGVNGWFDIWRINRDDSGFVRLTADGGQSGFATRAKTADKWVYRWAADFDQPATIKTMNGDGSSKFSVAAVGTALGHMFFSPDGTKIAFCSDAGGNGINGHLGIVSSEGGAITWLDTGSCRLGSDSACFPSSPWSPDAQWIVYSAKIGSQWDLFKIRPDGSQRIQLTSTPSEDELDAVYCPTLNPLDDGLVAYYPFDGNVNDASGNGNHGTVHGAALTTDRLGQAQRAYSFGRGNYIIVPDSASLRSPSNQVTVCAWARVDALDGGRSDWGPIVCKATSAPWQYCLELYNGGSGPPSAVFLGDGIGMSVSPPFQLGAWHHLAATYDGAVAIAYKDGREVGRVAHSGPLVVNGDPLYIGVDLPGSPEYMLGAVDEVRIYNRALAASEVQQIYFIEAGPQVDLAKAVKPSFSNLSLGTNYQLQVSSNLSTWTNQGSPFPATNINMLYPQYFDVANFGSLYFRLQVSP